MEGSPRAIQLVKQIEELRQWQKAQQERLAQQQEQQRLLLQSQQAEFYRNLGLQSPAPSVDNNVSYGNRNNQYVKSCPASSQSVHSHPSNKTINNNYKSVSPSPKSVDEIPLPKPQAVKPFTALLESTLKGNATQEPVTEPPKKFPFLRKGQGTSRFQPRQRYPSFRRRQNQNLPPNNAQLKSRPVEPKPAVKIVHEEKPKSPEVPSVASEFQDESSKGEEIPVRPSKEKDLQDLAVFELIEKFAELNSSFSFTSSMIHNLLEKNPQLSQPPSSILKILDNPSASPIMNDEDPKGTRHVHFAQEDDWETFQDETRHDSQSYAPESPSPCGDPSSSPDVSCLAVQSTPIIGGNVLHFSPPPSKPANSASHLIWDNFTRPRLEQEQRSSPQFPSLEDEEEQEDREESRSGVADQTTLLQGAVLRNKLLSLEREINIFRRENAHMRKTRQQLEEARLKLDQEREKFAKYADNEKRRLMLLVEEEKKKMKKAPPHAPGPEPQVRKLQQEIDSLREELRAKETKFFAEQTRLQEKCRAFEIKNRDLNEAVSKLSQEELSLRKKLNAALRPGGVKLQASKERSPIPTPVPLQPAVEPDISAESKPEDKNEQLCTPASQERIKPEEKVDPQPTVTKTHLPDGTVVFFYPNGNRKEVYPGQKGTKIFYFNGDVKEKLVDGTIIYTYGQTGTKHTTSPDGTETLHFANGQIEKTEPNGNKEVRYSNGAIQRKYANGSEECSWPDGTRLWSDGQGHGVLTMPSGQKEIYTPLCKRREYPDGTVQTLYPDGRMETRYPSGRLRVKDAQGSVILDTGNMPGLKAKS